MNDGKRAIFRSLAIFGAALLAGLTLRPFRDVSVDAFTLGMIVGAGGTLTLLGVAYGVWDARRRERRRKTKEQIWLKH